MHRAQTRGASPHPEHTSSRAGPPPLPTNDWRHRIGATILGRYRLLELIGEGGMGVVFRARQLSADRDVALKVLHHHLVREERTARRFQSEARIIAKLRHPNTIRLFECERADGGELIIVTELLSGRSLGGALAEDGALSPERAIEIGIQVCCALAEAHGMGVIHRDLKPDNIFLDRIGVDEVVKILDFGIAKDLEQRAESTRAGILTGTPQYVSPEQIRGLPIDGRADIYALGVVLFESLAGRLPFQETDPTELLRCHLEALPPRVDDAGVFEIPGSLTELVAQMLAKSPDRRPASVLEVRSRLRAIEHELADRRIGSLPDRDRTLILPNLLEGDTLPGAAPRLGAAAMDTTPLVEVVREPTPIREVLHGALPDDDRSWRPKGSPPTIQAEAGPMATLARWWRQLGRPKSEA